MPTWFGFSLPESWFLLFVSISTVYNAAVTAATVHSKPQRRRLPQVVCMQPGRHHHLLGETLTPAKRHVTADQHGRKKLEINAFAQISKRKFFP